MKTKLLSLFYGTIGFILLWPVFAYGGGIVQEANVLPASIDNPKPIKKHAHPRLCEENKKDSTNNTGTAQIKVIKELLTQIHIRYNETLQSTTITWSTQQHKQQDASSYMIYRKKRGTDDEWELIGVVNGATLTFSDPISSKKLDYEYRVIAVYRLTAPMWQSIPISLSNDTVPEEQLGMGCSTTQSPTTPPLWWMLLLIPLLSAYRQRP